MISAAGRRLSQALEEKKDVHHEVLEGHARWSATRLVIVVMAASWIARFLAPSVGYLLGIIASVASGWEGTVQHPGLGGPMANLGIALALALPIAKLFDRLRPSDVKEALTASLDMLKGLRSQGGSGGGATASGRLEGTDDRFSDDERESGRRA